MPESTESATVATGTSMVDNDGDVVAGSYSVEIPQSVFNHHTCTAISHTQRTHLAFFVVHVQSLGPSVVARTARSQHTTYSALALSLERAPAYPRASVFVVVSFVVGNQTIAMDKFKEAFCCCCITSKVAPAPSHRMNSVKQLMGKSNRELTAIEDQNPVLAAIALRIESGEQDVDFKTAPDLVDELLDGAAKELQYPHTFNGNDTLKLLHRLLRVVSVHPCLSTGSFSVASVGFLRCVCLCLCLCACARPQPWLRGLCNCGCAPGPGKLERPGDVWLRRQHDTAGANQSPRQNALSMP